MNQIQIFMDMIEEVKTLEEAEELMGRFNKELFNRMHGRMVDQEMNQIVSVDLQNIRKELQRKLARLKADKIRGKPCGVKAPRKAKRIGGR